jgi:uncharacterized protein (TIGR02145 family)
MRFTFHLNQKEFSMKKAKMLSLSAGLVLAITFTLSCSSDDGDKDEGGGSSCTNFKTKQIGTQTWMAENFNCNVEGSKCYDDDPANCAKYGRLYTWSDAMAVCPDGWHLPTKAEWDVLGDDAKKLKAKSGWNRNGNGTDDYGFSALPGGNGDSDGDFGGVGNYGSWWSASEYGSSGNYAYVMDIGYDYEIADWNYDDKSSLFSVRCLQD